MHIYSLFGSLGIYYKTLQIVCDSLHFNGPDILSLVCLQPLIGHFEYPSEHFEWPGGFIGIILYDFEG